MLIALLCLLAVLAAACGSDDPSVATDPGGGDGSGSDGTDEPDDPTGPDDPIGIDEWVLTAGSIDGAAIDPLPDYPATLQRRDGEVGGVAACNSYFGAFSDGPLLFDGFGVTEMACADQRAMDMEFTFLQALGRTKTASRSGDVLTLTGDGVDLTFEVIPPIPDSSLTGVTWQLDTIVEGAGASNAVGFEAVTLSFDDNGDYGGSDGCTPMGGTYTLDGDVLRVNDLVGADAQCPSDIAERTRDTVVAVLSSGPTLSIEANRLTLTAGDTALIYRTS